MKKYLCLFVLCLFSFCFGIVFAEDNLIAQMTAVKVGNLIFQLPAGFKNNYGMYMRQLDGGKIDSVQINATHLDPNYSEQYMANMKKEYSKIGMQSEEVNINGKKVLFINISGISVNAHFCENEIHYTITYVSSDYNSCKSFVMNLIRTAK